jgi:hypothetical protein
MTDVPSFDQLAALDLREELAHIDQMLADIEHKQADRRRMDAQIDQANADHDRKRQEIMLAPWALVLSGFTAGAAFFAAAVAFVRLFG